MSELTGDVQNLWGSRASILGTAFAAFVQVERQFCELCASTLRQVQDLDKLQTAPVASFVKPVTAADMPLAEPTAGMQQSKLLYLLVDSYTAHQAVTRAICKLAHCPLLPNDTNVYPQRP
jgi:hypothetical protein